MTIWDDRIMEIIQDGGPTSASELDKEDYIRTSRPNISRRLNKLADHGLLHRLPNGVYSLTDKGERYLNGELDAEELNEETESSDEGAHVGT
ncbi:PhiH1 repressor-like protein [Halorubrum distributum JCM 13561]|uniref:PhiH1 repressor-like protein n=2 Tax=Halorubrum distributum TaxID=29283 RepID=M0P305_9EURY|nr:PhiH1 repressor-like protein [Halorubrum litoreum JCM 13561]